MNIIEILSSILEWIKEIPTNTIKFFSNFEIIFDSISAIKDYIISVFNIIAPQTRATDGYAYITTIVYILVFAGMLFIMIDLVRDLL